jgi:hypothetical protein
MKTIILGCTLVFLVFLIINHKHIYNHAKNKFQLNCPEIASLSSTNQSISSTRVKVPFPADLDQLFQKSLQEPCKTDYYVECWFGQGSKLNMYTYLMIDAMLMNKTVSVWDNKKDRRRSQLAMNLRKTFNTDAFPICLGDEHTGEFYNDGASLKAFKKINIEYVYYMSLLSGSMRYLFDNVRPEIQQKVDNILKFIPKSFITINVRWGSKVKIEAKKTLLPVYIDLLNRQPKPDMVLMMSMEKNVTDRVQEATKIRTVNLQEDIIVEMMLAARGAAFIGSESSNMYRVIWKLRNGENCFNVEDPQNKKIHPIRMWLVRKWNTLRRLRRLL